MTKVEKFFMGIILFSVPLFFIFWKDIENGFRKEQSILPQKATIALNSNLSENKIKMKMKIR